MANMRTMTKRAKTTKGTGKTGAVRVSERADKSAGVGKLPKKLL